MAGEGFVENGIATGISGLINSIVGIGQRHKGNKLLNSLEYPTEQLPSEYTQNQNLAQTMASSGMPAEQYSMAMKNIQRQQLAALRSASDRRGGLGALPGVLQATNDASLNLDAENSRQRIANQRNLITVNNQVAGAKRDIFDKNIRDKYMRDYNYAMGLKGIGNQNLVGGIDRLGAGGALVGYGASGRRGANNQYSMGIDDFNQD